MKPDTGTGATGDTVAPVFLAGAPLLADGTLHGLLQRPYRAAPVSGCRCRLRTILLTVIREVANVRSISFPFSVLRRWVLS